MRKYELLEYIAEKYGVPAEHPFAKLPDVTVFRHDNNKKWFAVIMRINASKLGIFENRDVNIVNLKCTEETLDITWNEEGVFPAYHMNKRHWISVLLDGSVMPETVKALLNISYNATLK